MAPSAGLRWNMGQKAQSTKLIRKLASVLLEHFRGNSIGKILPLKIVQVKIAQIGIRDRPVVEREVPSAAALLPAVLPPRRRLARSLKGFLVKGRPTAPCARAKRWRDCVRPRPRLRNQHHPFRFEGTVCGRWSQAHACTRRSSLDVTFPRFPLSTHG